MPTASGSRVGCSTAPVWVAVLALGCSSETVDSGSDAIFGGAPICGEQPEPDFSVAVRFIDGTPQPKPGGGWYVPMFQDQAVLDLASDGTELARFDLSETGVTSSKPAAIALVGGEWYFMQSRHLDDGTLAVEVDVLASGIARPVPRARVTIPGRYAMVGIPALIESAEGLVVMVAGQRQSEEDRYAADLWYTPLGIDVDSATTPLLLSEAWYPSTLWPATNASGTALSGVNAPIAILDPTGHVLTVEDPAVSSTPIGIRDATSWYRAYYQEGDYGDRGALWLESFDRSLQPISVGSPIWSCKGDEWELCGRALAVGPAIVGAADDALVVWQRDFAPYDDLHAEVVLSRVDSDSNPIGCSLSFEGGYAYPYAASWDGTVASVFWIDGWPLGVSTYYMWTGEFPAE